MPNFYLIFIFLSLLSIIGSRKMFQGLEVHSRRKHSRMLKQSSLLTVFHPLWSNKWVDPHLRCVTLQRGSRPLASFWWRPRMFHRVCVTFPCSSEKKKLPNRERGTGYCIWNQEISHVTNQRLVQNRPRTINGQRLCATWLEIGRLARVQGFLWKEREVESSWWLSIVRKLSHCFYCRSSANLGSISWKTP